jgi:hypothetical protein
MFFHKGIFMENFDFNFDVKAIDQELETTGYVILKPPGFYELIKAARADYDKAFKICDLQPPKKKFHYLDLPKNPWRKQAIGSKNGVGEAYAQILQTIYFDINQTAYPALKTLFKLMALLRNQLMRVADDFADNPEKDRFWNACRVHHYPQGGGFMMTHHDTYFPVQLGDLPFYQILVPLSEKGKDFSEGGGIVINKNGVKINTDELGGMGSMVIFDGRIQHGVDDVDPHEIMDFKSNKGRLAAFVGLYVTPT